MKIRRYIPKFLLILIIFLSTSTFNQAEDCVYTVDASNQVVIEFTLPRHGTAIDIYSVDGNKISFDFTAIGSVTPTFHLTGPGLDEELTTGSNSYTHSNGNIDVFYSATLPNTVFDLIFFMTSSNMTEPFTITVTTFPSLGVGSEVTASISSLRDAVNEIPGDLAGEATFTNCTPTDTPPVATITSPAGTEVTISEGDSLVFQGDGTDDGTITARNWNFGGGGTPATASGGGPHTIVFNTAGDYTVTFTVEDNATPTPQTGSATVTVHVLGTPEIQTDQNVYNFSAQVGHADTQEIIISNSGGGSFDIADITVPVYNDGDKGYFQVSFDNADFYNPVLPPPPITITSPDSLYVRYIPIKPDPVPLVKTLTITNTSSNPNKTVTLSATGTTPTDRPPFDFIAVLDKSGSMGGTSSCPEADPVTKMEGLKSAAGLFYEIMREIADESEDKIALIEYNSSPVLTVSMGWADSDKIDDTEEAVEDLSPGGSTSITGALEMAINTFYSSAESRNRGILLLTDGRHNTPSWDFENDFDDPDDSAVHMSNIHLYTVGLGNTGNLKADLLKQIATEPFGPSNQYQFAVPGGYRHTCSIGKLGIYFAQILVENLDSAEQIVEDDEGEVKEGETSIETMPITPSTQKAVFYLTWQDPDKKLRFTLVAPDGTEIDPGYGIVKNGYAIYSLDFPLIHNRHPVNHAGDWQMIISVFEHEPIYIADSFNTLRTGKFASTPGPNYSPPLASGQTNDEKVIAYESALIARDPVIHADFKVEGTRYYTGDQVLLTATLTEAGEPLLGADDVKAIVDVPAVALGDFLYDNDISGDITAITDPDGSADSTAAKKLRLLLEENPGGLGRTIFQLPMVDNGTNGDVTANDGVYTLRLQTSGSDNQTENNGIYTYKFKAGGKTLSGHRFDRTSATADYLVSLPDPGNSSVLYHYLGGRRDIDARLIVKLKDKFGHHLPPITTRKYNVFSKDPSKIDFTVNNIKDLLNGELVFDLIATSGEFSPNLDVKNIIGFEVGGTNMQPVSLKPKLFRWKYYIEPFIGRFNFSNSIPVKTGYVYGLKLGYNFGNYWSVEGEFGFTPAEDLYGVNGTVLQYSLNIGFTPLLNMPHFNYFFSLGIGRLNFNGFTNDDNALAFNIGGGIIWYPDWQKKYGFSFMIRDFIAVDAFGNNITHNLQYNVGIRFRF